MQEQPYNQFSVSSLRIIPYTVLIKAISSGLMLAGFLLAFRNAHAVDTTWGDAAAFVLVVEMLLLVSYILIMYHLHGLIGLAKKIYIAFYLFLAIIMLLCITILISSLELFLVPDSSVKMKMTINIISLSIFIANTLIYATGMFMLMSGFAEAVRKTGSCKYAVLSGRIGEAFLVIAVFQMISTIIMNRSITGFASALTLLSEVLSLLCEFASFVLLSRMSLRIWQYYTIGGAIRK